MKKVSAEVEVIDVSELPLSGDADFSIDKYPEILQAEFACGRMEVTNYGLLFNSECTGLRLPGNYPFQAMKDDSVIYVPGEGIVIMKSVDASKIWK